MRATKNSVEEIELKEPVFVPKDGVLGSFKEIHPGVTDMVVDWEKRAVRVATKTCKPFWVPMENIKKITLSAKSPSKDC